MIESTDFIVGEKKKVFIKIRSLCRSPMEVTKATYSLGIGDEEEDSGECEICEKSPTETIISALIQPMRKNAIYDLRYFYEIYPEKLEYRVRVRVT